MKKYYRVMLGKRSVHAPACFAGDFIGINDDTGDLTNQFPDNWRAFNSKFIPVFLQKYPDKSKIAAGLACGVMWTLGKGIGMGDFVLCPDGGGRYHVGEVTGEYAYHPGDILPHRRPVRWLEQIIDRSDMSVPLKNSTGSVGTMSNISAYREEIEKLLGSGSQPALIATDSEVEDPAAFAMERHLENFLVQNWGQMDLGREYDIYEEEGERVGQQYDTDTGPIDILAVSKDKKILLVVELKKGRASDAVVGQTLRYMGYVQEELAEEGQTVRGAIIALEDDQRIRRALMVVPNIAFYRYQISFRLLRG
jgi:restriction system protein